MMVGLKEEYESLSNDGFRVLAVAYKDCRSKQICVPKTTSPILC